MRPFATASLSHSSQIGWQNDLEKEDRYTRTIFQKSSSAARAAV